MMDKIRKGSPGTHTKSFFFDDSDEKVGLLRLPKPGVKNVFSKLGFGTGGGELFADVAYIERENSGKILRYVAIGIGATAEKVLSDLILDLDSAVVATNL